jgi:SAM-dependent methyltransferase
VRRSERNPFRSVELARAYEGWYDAEGRRASALERDLLGRLLEHLGPVRSALEIGCGTGHFSRWLASRGIAVTGLDPSLPMLEESHRLGVTGVIAADGSSLPFHRLSFDVVLLVTVLECAGDSEAVLREASRVSRIGLLVGALNRHSSLGLSVARRRDQPWGSARLPTVGELRRLVQRGAGERRPTIRWSTTLCPAMSRAVRLPWRGFIGLSARWASRSSEERTP